MGILLWSCNIISCISCVESGGGKGPRARGNQGLEELQEWLESVKASGIKIGLVLAGIEGHVRSLGAGCKPKQRGGSGNGNSAHGQPTLARRKTRLRVVAAILGVLAVMALLAGSACGGSAPDRLEAQWPRGVRRASRALFTFAYGPPETGDRWPVVACRIGVWMGTPGQVERPEEGSRVPFSRTAF